MGKISWTTTLVPLAIAVGGTVKAYFTGGDLSETEIELIKYMMGIFMASAGVGGAVSIAKKLKKP